MCPLPPSVEGGARQPCLKSADATTLAREQDWPQHSIAVFISTFFANFGESPKGEVRALACNITSGRSYEARIHLPRTPVRIRARRRAEIWWRDKGISGTHGAALGPDAEAGHGLGDALIMEAHPVALAEFGPGPSMLLLIDLL